MKKVSNLKFVATPEDETWPLIILIVAIFVIFICCVGNILKLRSTFRKLRKASNSYNVFQPAPTLSSNMTVVDMQTSNLSEEAVNSNKLVEEYNMISVEPKPPIDK